MPKKEPTPKDVAGQFSDEEMEGVKRYGQALGGQPTAFDEEVEKHLAGHEAHFAKMRAAETGGGELGPTQFETQQQKQAGAMIQNQALQGAQQAAQAQAAATSPQAPPAPSGSAGVSAPYPAEKKPGSAPGAAAGHPEEPEEEESPTA